MAGSEITDQEFYPHDPNIIGEFQAALTSLAEQTSRKVEIDGNNLQGLPESLKQLILQLVRRYQASEQRITSAIQAYPRKLQTTDEEQVSHPELNEITAELEKLSTADLARTRHNLRQFRADFSISTRQTEIRVKLSEIPYAIIGVIQRENTLQQETLRELLNTLDTIIGLCGQIIRSRKTREIQEQLRNLDREETRAIRAKMRQSRFASYNSPLLQALDVILEFYQRVNLRSYIEIGSEGHKITIYDRGGQKVIPWPIQVAIPRLARALGEEDGRTEIETLIKALLGLPGVSVPYGTDKETALEEMNIRLKLVCSQTKSTETANLGK